MKKMKILLFLLCIFAAAGAAADAPLELQPPAKPQATVWLEGEEFAETRGGVVNAGDGSCYGGKSWTLLTQEDGEYTVKYKFRVPRDGFYTVQVAGQPVGTGYTSPIWYAVDGGAWVKKETLPASKAVWGISRALRWTALGTVALESGEHTLEFKIDQRRSQDSFYAYNIDAIALMRDADALPDLRGSRPGNVFTTEQPLVFQSDPALTFGSWQWRVVDWQGNEKSHGAWEAKTGALTLPQLPVGYYRLQLQDKQGQWSRWLPFARILPPPQRKQEMPYAVDSAQSWLVAPGYAGNSLQPAGAYELISDLERMGGFSMIRDRLKWREVNPEPGIYKWGRYETNAALLSERGIAVLGMFHDAPSWAKEGLKSLPHDLMATYEFCKAAAQKFSGQILAWEFWNEPDLMSFNQDPSWDLAAAHKAAYLGFKAGDPNVDVLIASNCQHSAMKMYELLLQNGVGDYMDVFNFHFYGPLEEYQQTVESKRQFLARYLASKPMWVTENGLAAEGTGKEEPIVPGSDLREHDSRQELAQAELMIKSQITMQSLGVERDFSFVFPPYNEQGGGKVWGMFRWDYTVKPAYVAFANLIRQLGDCRYLGKLDFDGISAFLYGQPDGGQVLVYWTEKETAVGLTLKEQGKKLELADFLGCSQTIASESGVYQLTAGRFPSYLKGLAGLEPTELPIPKGEPEPPQATDPDTVLRVDLGKGFTAPTQVMAKLEGTVGNIDLDIFNFSEEPKTITLENMSDAYLLLGMPEDVKVPAMGKTRIALKLVLSPGSPGRFDLKLRAHSGGLLGAPVLIPISTGSVEGLNLEEKLLSAAAADRWLKNASGSMNISYDQAEEAVRFDVAFSPGASHWVYPVFTLRPEENLKGAVGLSFEVKAAFAPANAGNPYNVAYVMAVLEDELETGKRVDFSYQPTAEWQKVDILFSTEAPADFDPKDVKLLRIGLNPRQNNLTYWLRNLKGYYQK